VVIAEASEDRRVHRFLEGLSRQARMPTHPTRSQPLRKQRANGIRAAYDAAQHTETNKLYWANADLLSADAANSLEKRKTLRSRSRYECLEANSFAKGIVNTLANDMIGRGPTLQILLEEEQAEAIEGHFHQWAKQVNLARKLRTARKARFVDGEVFLRLVTNRKLGPVQLDIEVIEADRVTNMQGIEDPINEVDGIIFDADGNPESYQVLKYHPGDDYFVSIDADTVPAEQMIHWFRCDRPGQHRGVPECTTALPLFILFRDYTLAVVQNARSVAKHTVLLKTSAGSVTDEGDSFDSTVDPFDGVDIDYDMLTSLPHGWEPHQLRADQPTTTYEMFRRAIWGEIARTADMPYNVAAADSSKHNYASGQLDRQPYDHAISVDRNDCESVVLDVILEAWFAEAVLAGVIPEELSSQAQMPHEWYWTSREHADPTKKANADGTEVRIGTATITEKLKAKGKNPERHYRQGAADFGVSVPQYKQLIAAATFNAQPLLAEILAEIEDEEDEEIPDEATETAEAKATTSSILACLASAVDDSRRRRSLRAAPGSRGGRKRAAANPPIRNGRVHRRSAAR
jgi:capsid protein